jgi:hypothetical protein
VAANIRRPIDRADLDGLRHTLDELERSRDPELPATRRIWLLAVWLIRWCGFTVPILAMVVWLSDRSWCPSAYTCSSLPHRSCSL